MPAFNFKKEFVDDVLSRRKRGTIRAKRRHQPRVGQKAYLFYGMRTNKCRRLGNFEILSVVPITIDHGTVVYGTPEFTTVLGDLGDLNLFAIKDGFDDWNAMITFFIQNYSLPFEGDFIQW